MIIALSSGKTPVEANEKLSHPGGRGGKEARAGKKKWGEPEDFQNTWKRHKVKNGSFLLGGGEGDAGNRGVGSKIYGEAKLFISEYGKKSEVKRKLSAKS